MDLLARLPLMEPVWSGTGVTLAALIAALLLRRLLPASARQQGRGTLALLAVAMLLRLATLGAAAVPGFEIAVRLLRVAHVVLLVLGLVGLGGLIAFDIVLARTGLLVPSILRNLIRGSLAALVLLWLWREATGDIVSLVTTSTVLAVLGLALQGTIANLFAGLTLQLERSFQLGQWIRVGEDVGRILEVRSRHTALLKRDGDVVLVPNADLVSRQVVHLGGPGGAERIECQRGIRFAPPTTVRHARCIVGEELAELDEGAG